MIAARYALLAWVVTGFAAWQAPGQQTVTMARTTLEDAHTLQGEILERLAQLSSHRQQAGGTAEVLDTLRAIYRKQTSLVRNLQVWRVTSLQQAADQNTRDDPSQDLMRHQREIHRDFTDWVSLIARITADDQGTRDLKQIEARARGSSADAQMQTVLDHLQAGHVSQALESASTAAEELARLLQMLELAVGDPQKVREKQLSDLREIVAAEKGIRSRLQGDSIGRTEWRSLRHDQSGLRERLKLLTFEEAGFSEELAENVNLAHDGMSSAEDHMLRRKQDEALEAVEDVIRALDIVISGLESMAAAGATDPDMIAPPSIRRKEIKEGIMPAMLGAGSEGLDKSPGAMIAADIALLVKIKKRQIELHAETTGEQPAKPLAARRQMDYAADLPQLARRVERYLPEAATLISEAQAAMVASYERLKAGEKEQSIPHQKLAIDRMSEAERIMRAWWKELLEALEMISTPGGQAPAHGASEEEAAKEDLLMILMREIVRVGRLMKTLEVQMALVEGWSQAAADTVDPDAVRQAVEAHVELKELGLDIFDKLLPLGGEAESLPEALMEASQFIEGASDVLRERNYSLALERDRTAMNFLSNAWVYLAMSMASMGESQQADESDKSEDQGDAELRDGETVAAGQGTGAGDNERWEWELANAARDAVEQSQAGELPPKYETAIKRYYERLSRRK